MKQQGKVLINLEFFQELTTQFTRYVKAANKILQDDSKRDHKSQLSYISNLSKAQGILTTLIKECDLLTNDVKLSIMSAHDPGQLAASLDQLLSKVESGQLADPLNQLLSKAIPSEKEKSSLIVEVDLPKKLDKLKN